jgi:hypothetical protein
MAINFSAQFIVNEKTSTRVLRLTDTSTGFTLSKGNFIVTFPDGSVVSNTDFSSPEISAPGGNTSISLITDIDNTVLTGTYVINYVALDTSLNEYNKTETFDFNWEKPAKTIINDSDVVLPEVQFKDLTAYETSGSFTGVLTRNFYTTTPSTSEVGVITKTSVGDILTPSHLTKYYEGIYLVNSDISVAYTHTSKSWLTVAYTDLLQETFDVREAPTQDELVALMNTYKDQIEAYKSTNPSQYEIMNEQYDLVLALYSHIIARYQTTTLDGSKAILDQLLGLLPPASSYTYKATQMLPFTINFTTSLTGSGTTGTIPKFTGTATLGDSIIKEDTNRIGIGKTPTTTLDVNGTIQGTSIVKSGGISSQFLKADGSVDANTYLTTGSASSNYQPLDGDLTAIAALAGAAGILTKVSANTWSLDTTSYQVLDADLTAIAALAGTSGFLKKTSANTWTLDTTSYQTLDADLTAIAELAGTSGLIRKTAANTYELDTSVYLTGINSGQITTALGFTPENAANKGVNNGYAGLDSTGKVPSTQLPSYVDDVLEAANVAALPATGETGKIYITLDTNKIYRWTGSVYVEISPTVGTVWGGITGTLSNQTDLQDALNAKFNNPTGLASQYIRGDGTLAVLPAGGGGGGGGVSYYLNGSINQGTIGGVTYYEMNKVPIIGAGTDFSRSSNGYIASFLTDANDPALLNIPAGNWNFETYLQASNGGGSPSFYIELYKYDGTTFTLIASNSGTPKLINDGANIEAYFSALAVPQTTLTLTDRLAIRIYVNTAGRTITLHTENGHLCQVVTTFSSGLSALNGLTAQVQYFATGTSGTDFNISSSTATHTFNLPTASATNRGALSSADWITFNGKASLTNPVFTDNIYISGTNPRLYFTDTDSNPDYTIFIDEGNFYILNQTSGAYKLLIQETGNISAGVGNSMIATSFIKRGGTSEQFLMADGSVTTGAVFNYPGIGIAVSGGGGWLTSIDDNSANWNAAYSARISSLTTTGNSGAATLASNVLNIPNYTIAGLGGQPAFTSGTGFVKISGTTISYVNETYLTLSGGTLTGALGGTSATFSSSVTATSFAIPSGSSAGFLKADGSVDVRTFITTGALDNYLPLTGGSLTNSLSSGYVLSVTNTTEAAGANGLYVNIASGSTGTPFRVDRGGVSLITVNHLGATLLKSTITANAFIKASGTSSEYLMADGSVSTGLSFTYPGAGIVTSTGSAWGTSITDNSSNWNTAFGWGNHAGLYLPIGGGTLTGALNGTTASFTGQLTARATSTSAPSTGTGLYLGWGGSTNNYNGINFQGVSATDMYFGRAISSDDLVIRSASGEIIRFTASGAATFSSSVTASGGKSQFVADGGTGAGAEILLKTSLTSNPTLRRNWAIATEDQIEGDFVIKSSNAAGGSPITARLVILSNGNVIIGNTADAGFKFDVTGTGRFNGNGTSRILSSLGDNNALIIQNTAASPYGVEISFPNAAPNNTTNHFLRFADSSGTKATIFSSGAATFSSSIAATSATFSGNAQAAFLTITQSGGQIASFNSTNANGGYMTWGTNGTTIADIGTLQQIFGSGGATNFGINARGAKDLGFGTNNTERLRITSAGNVGIGTTSPVSYSGYNTLTIAGNTNGGVLAVRNPSGFGVNLSGTGNMASIDAIDATAAMRFTTNDTERMRITSGGDVIVGNGTQSVSLAIDRGSSSGSNGLRFRTAGANNWYVGSGATGTNTDLEIYNHSTATSNLRISYSTGNVGIGTTTPGATRLYVVAATSSPGLRIEADAGQNALSIGGTGNISVDYPGIGGGRFLLNGDGALTIRSSMTASSFFESSDKTIKTLIEDNYQTKGIESVTAKLYLKNGVEELGYFAQDLQGILPSAVSKGADGLLSLSYREVHTAKIARLEKRVEELEAQLNLL